MELTSPVAVTRTVDVTLPTSGSIVTAWNSAMAAAASGDKLRIAGGAYTSGGNLDIDGKTGLTIEFTGPTTITYTDTFYHGLRIKGSSSNIFIKGYAAANSFIEPQVQFKTSGVSGRGDQNMQGNATLSIDVGCNNINVQDVSFVGAKAAAVFNFGGSYIKYNRVWARNSLADGFHNTYGAHHVTAYDCTSQNNGDDGFAVVHYSPRDLPSLQSHDVSVTRHRVLGNTHGRGIAVINSYAVTIDTAFISGTSAGGLWIVDEWVSGSNTRAGIHDISASNVYIYGANYDNTIDHGPWGVMNGDSTVPATNVTLSDITSENHVTGAWSRVVGPGADITVNRWVQRGTPTVQCYINQATVTGQATWSQTTAKTTPNVAQWAPTSTVTAFTGDLLFEDDFNGTAGASYDTTKWEDFSTATYNSSAAFGNIQPGNNETLDGQGNLIIPATPTAGSAIRSKFGFVYGVMSVWMKAPSQVGYWPAFWTLNNNRNGVDVLPLAEIDVAELYTTWKTDYHAVGHTWVGNGVDQGSADFRVPDTQNPNSVTVPDISASFNKYSAKVEPGKVTFYFNDVPVAVWDKPVDGRAWALGPDVTRDNWMILNLAIGGAGGAQTAATQNAQLLVDRVEVRALVPTTPTGLSTIRWYPRQGTETGREIGGKFQGSNNANPSDLTSGTWTDLYTITNPVMGWNDVHINVDLKTYKYLRYLSPNGGWGNIGEIEYYVGGTYGNGGVKAVPASTFGTPGSYANGSATYDKALDGNESTFFDSAQADGNIIGVVMPSVRSDWSSAVTATTTSVALTTGLVVIDRWNGTSLQRQFLENWNGTQLISVQSAMTTPAATVSETFTVSDGSSWPPVWATAASTTGTSIIDVQSGKGRMLVQSNAWTKARYTSFADATNGGITATISTPVYGQYANGEIYLNVVADAGTDGLPYNGMSLVLYIGEAKLGSYTQFVRSVNGVRTNIGYINVPTALVGSSSFKAKIERSGNQVRARVWGVTDTEPTDWLIQTSDLTEAPLSTGKPGLSVLSRAGDPLTVTFDDVNVYAPTT
jgi:beta-glucanase (GH16 family)